MIRFLFLPAAGANIRLVGSDPGVMAAFNWGTHMPFEDFFVAALFLPELTIVEPTDSVMLVNLMDQLAKLQGVHYIRMARKPMAKVYQEGSDFTIGKGCVIRPGSDVTIVAAGIMVRRSDGGPQSCWQPMEFLPVWWTCLRSNPLMKIFFNNLRAGDRCNCHS